MSKYETIIVGDKAEVKHKITVQDIERFVELTGDDNKLHIDPDYASRTSFKKPVVHGMLGASFISTLIGTKLPGDGSLWFSQNIEFLRPIRIGDEIKVVAEVIKKLDCENIVELKTDIFNQHGQLVTTGSAKVKVMEQEEMKQDKCDSERKKVAVVIGATGGIGKAVSIGLANDGFDVIVHYHYNEEQAFKLKEDIEAIGRRALVVRADIVDEASVETMMEKIKRNHDTITVLVNCTTARIINKKFNLLKWEDIQEHLDINVKGTFNLMKYVVPLMEMEKYGKIINITTQAIETVNSEWLPYITGKAALNGFTKAAAVELAPKGIRLNMVSPGMTDTPLIADIPEKTRLINMQKTPLRRMARPEDIAGAIRYLASESADFLTGETIRINGGQVML